mgnify:CR=1 FL=1
MQFSKWKIGAVALVCMLLPGSVHAQIVKNERLLSFEEKQVPAFVTTAAGSQLGISDEHYRDGDHSLSWTFEPGAALSIKKDLKFAFDGFFCYDLPLRRVFKKMSFAGRYDYMSDHSNGIPDDNGLLFVNDLERHRVTAGITFSFGLPFMADIRLNYEMYFYDKGVVPKVSEHDKIVLEFMAHF